MLVLSRKLNESIKIGDNIEVKVLSIDGDQIKLGIDAPRNIDIHRKEIFVAIQAENTEAANTSVDLLKNLTQSLKKESK